VPLFPLSREISRLEDLKRSLALYRLVFGQPRQEELLRLLRTRADASASAAELQQYRIDLSPSKSEAIPTLSSPDVPPPGRDVEKS
jgi:hypothetical protein